MSEPIYHSAKDTWRLEFQTFKNAPHRKKLIELRDGEVVEVGKRYSEDGYYVTEGKERAHSTGSLFMCAGLDGIEEVHRDASDPDVVIVADRHGGVAAYHIERKLAADSSGEQAKNAAQMGAVMAGERIASQGARKRLRVQYRYYYDEYMQARTAGNLLRATDAFYALSKHEEIYPGFAAEEMLPFLHSTPIAVQDRTARLRRQLYRDGPAVVRELLAASRGGVELTGGEVHRLITAVTSFASDVESFRVALEEDLCRVDADLALAQTALARLLAGVDHEGPA